MFDAEAIKRAFSRAAPSYDKHAHLQRDVRAECVALARNHMPAQTKLLDAGCGTGASHDDLHEGGFRGNITAFDLSWNMCAHAAGHHSRIVNADAAAMPFANGSFEGLMSSLMLQWVNDTQAVFREMARVLTPGGHAVISTLTRGTLGELQQSFSALDDDPHVSEFLMPDMLRDLSSNAGFFALHAKSQDMIEYYPSAKTLMRALQAIGAGNKHTARRRGLMTPQQFSRMEEVYEQRFRSKQGLPVTWRVMYLVLKKA